MDNQKGQADTYNNKDRSRGDDPIAQEWRKCFYLFQHVPLYDGSFGMFLILAIKMENTQISVDAAFCNAITLSDLERYDALHKMVVTLYESSDHEGMDRLIDLVLGTEQSGFVYTLLMSIKPVKHAVSEDKWDRLMEFRKKKLKENKRWIKVTEGLPEICPGIDPLGRAMSKKVLVQYALGHGLDYSVDRVYYQDGCEPRWWSLQHSVVAWMDFPA